MTTASTLDRIVNQAMATHPTPQSSGVGPFELIKQSGGYRTVLFAGGACMIVFDGHCELSQEWDSHMDSIERAVVKMTLRALFDLGKAHGRTVTFYPEGTKSRSVS
jgi:hypothetical protein